MTNMERFREAVSVLPDADVWRQRHDAGWRLVALEWERPASAEAAPRWTEEVPYGLRVSDDCGRLVENPVEVQVLMTALDLIVRDCPLSGVAGELNKLGHRTRTGARWTATAIFNLLPRLIDAGPRIFSLAEWEALSPRLPRL